MTRAATSPGWPMRSPRTPLSRVRYWWPGPRALGRGLLSTLWTAGSSTSARSAPRTLHGADLWSSRFRGRPDRGPGTRLRLTSGPDAGEVAVSRDLVDDAHVRELSQRPPGCVRRDPQ